MPYYPGISPITLDKINGRVGLGVPDPASLLEMVGAGGTTEIRMTRPDATSSGPRIRFRKARGNQATPEVVTENDTIGVFTFNTYRNGAYQGSDGPASVMFHAVVDGTPAGDSAPGRFAFFTTSVGETSNTERLRIASNGRVGIGITTISQSSSLITALLHLASSTTERASLCLVHGVAPTSPVNGDIWTTSAGLFVQINGATVGPLS